MPQLWVREVEVVASSTALRALFTVEVEGLGRIAKCRYLETAKSAFVTGPSFRDRFTVGGWAQPIVFDADVAGELLEAVRLRLAQDTAQ